MGRNKKMNDRKSNGDKFTRGTDYANLQPSTNDDIDGAKLENDMQFVSETITSGISSVHYVDNSSRNGTVQKNMFDDMVDRNDVLGDVNGPNDVAYVVNNLFISGNPVNFFRSEQSENVNLSQNGAETTYYLFVALFTLFIALFIMISGRMLRIIMGYPDPEL